MVMQCSVAVVLNSLALVCGLNTVYNTDIIIPNKQYGSVNVYNLTINCRSDNWCSAEPITMANRWYHREWVWGVSDAKRIIYGRKDAILMQHGSCATVRDGFDSEILYFHKCVSASLNIHAVEALPDGNVVLLDSAPSGYGYLLRKGSDPTDGHKWSVEYAQIANMKIQYGHGLAYDRIGKLLYVLEYLKLSAFSYDSITENFTLVKTENFASLYQSNNKSEDKYTEDGGHDLYPASPTSLFVTTGERVFLYRPTEKVKFAYHRRFFYVLSKNGLANESHPNVIKFKGGIKSISKDMDSGITLAKSAPWFQKCEKCGNSKNDCELQDNYDTKGGNGFVWYLPNSQCGTPNFDVAERGLDDCNIRFGSDLKIYAYKARIYRIPTFSYDTTGVRLNRYTVQP